MKKQIPLQLIIGVGILVIGAAFLGLEYLLVRWAPIHRQHVEEETLKPIPYHNDGLGVDLAVAAGIDGKVVEFPGGVRIYRPRLWGGGPALTITTQPNPDHSFEFSPQILAIWETDGTLKGIPDYHFDHTKIMDRDAVIISQTKDRTTLLTARVITPERIVEADCTPGNLDVTLYFQACESTVRSLKVAGTEPPAAAPAVEANPLPFKRLDKPK